MNKDDVNYLFDSVKENVNVINEDPNAIREVGNVIKEAVINFLKKQNQGKLELSFLFLSRKP